MVFLVPGCSGLNLLSSDFLCQGHISVVHSRYIFIANISFSTRDLEKMAEIKSTMQMVLERAAKMTAETSPVPDDDHLIKDGMRIAADFLNEKITDLHKELVSQPAETQIPIRKGIAQTLLRNIVLPRNEDLQESGAIAIKGILLLSENSGEIATICKELQQIIEQYGQHKEQTTQQLKDALRAQIEQQQAASDQPQQGTVNPAMHPQYKEELTKMLTSLNNQYNDAMTQRKEMILSRLCLP
jgi:hypothetical protein